MQIMFLIFGKGYDYNIWDILGTAMKGKFITIEW